VKTAGRAEKISSVVWPLLSLIPAALFIMINFTSMGHKLIFDANPPLYPLIFLLVSFYVLAGEGFREGSKVICGSGTDDPHFYRLSLIHYILGGVILFVGISSILNNFSANLERYNNVQGIFIIIFWILQPAALVIISRIFRIYHIKMVNLEDFRKRSS